MCMQSGNYSRGVLGGGICLFAAAAGVGWAGGCCRGRGRQAAQGVSSRITSAVQATAIVVHGWAAVAGGNG